MKILSMITLLFLSLSVGAQTKKLKVEPNHSTIGFNISISGFSVVTGKFTAYEISLDWNEKLTDSSKISAIIKVESINTGIPERDEHLQSADFFDVTSYPNITFQSDSIKKIDYSNFEAHGTLTMHGITHPFILPFQIVKIENNTIGISSKTTLNRLDYGVGSDFNHSSMPNFLSDEIELEFHFWTKRRKE